MVGWHKKRESRIHEGPIFPFFSLKNDFRSSIKELSEMEKESCHAAYTRHAPMSTYLINIRTVSVKVDSNIICTVPEFRQFRSILHTKWTIAYHEPAYVFVSFHIKGVTLGWTLYVDLTTIKAALNLHNLTSTHTCMSDPWLNSNWPNVAFFDNIALERLKLSFRICLQPFHSIYLCLSNTVDCHIMIMEWLLTCFHPIRLSSLSLSLSQ